MKVAIVYFSYHHMNTEKVAKEITGVLGADLKKVGAFDPLELAEYDLIGFGSGIYMEKHHKSLLQMVANMPALKRKAFIFSTSGRIHNAPKPFCHNALRISLQRKDFDVIDEFNCPGFDTVIFVRLIHGGKALNEGRPNEEDIRKAQVFAKNLKNKVSLAAVL